MQPAPFRLQQAIWTAFKAANPRCNPAIQQSFFRSSLQPSQFSQPLATSRQQWQPALSQHIRYYSDSKKSDIESKIEDAKNRIDESLEARAENTRTDDDPLKTDETIIHTLPESSSIVYNPDSPGETAAKATSQEPQSVGSTSESPAQDGHETHSSDISARIASLRSQLPSQLSKQYSTVRQNFSSFMDNFQSHIFIASRRLNDLTGYSSIERLKRDIEEQEHSVRQARQNVRDSRSAYSAAIETRSNTQREVNDLLHRKHAWSPTDLERFTNLYRSDHANEQAEQKSHSDLAAAEAAYEEASTKLSKSILARYHEEQVWSDKIRQMSTWGTWGLMGLNVLLFIVFQILVEPWRRRRLVRGFEEKVQDALKTNAEDKELIEQLKAEKVARSQILPAENIAAASAATIVITDTKSEPSEQGGSTGTETSTSTIGGTERASEQRTQIGQAAEALTTAGLLSESTTLTPPNAESPISETPLHTDITPQLSTDISPQLSETATTTTATTTSSPSETQTTDIPSTAPSTETPTFAEHEYEYKDIPFILGSHTRTYLNRARTYLDRSQTHIKSLFDEKVNVTLSRRELTAKVLEGAFFGAVGVVTLFWVVGVGSVR